MSWNPARYQSVFPLAIALSAALFLTLFLSTAHADFVRIEGSVVNVRQGPGTSFPVLFQAQAGEEYSLVSTEGLWCRIKLSDGKEAWVFRKLIGIVPGSLPESLGAPEKADVKPAREGGSRIVYLATGMTALLILVLAVWRRRELGRYAGSRMREMSGYRRDQPFRYDDLPPEKDSWEL